MIRDLIALENTSKVWLYQAHRELTYDELDFIRPRIFEFLERWTSHNQQLMTYGNVFHRRFLGLFVDETLSGASGCSIDKSVHFVESMGAQLKIDFFQRSTFCYLKEDVIYDVQSSELNTQLQDGLIDDETLFFDNNVKDKDAFLKRWLVPFKESWHYRFV